MTRAREPILLPVAIADLRPTQITVGRREVEIKRKAWRKKGGGRGRKFLGRHMMPTILGPRARHYIIDHHHLALALLEEGVKDVLVVTEADLSGLETDTFWMVMETRSWAHPFDEKGRRRDYAHIPKSLTEMRDDPFRSLAGELRRIGGFAKETLPYNEFLWADFLRRRMKRSLVQTEFTRALEQALSLAKSAEAGYLPGWCGASPND